VFTKKYHLRFEVQSSLDIFGIFILFILGPYKKVNYNDGQFASKAIIFYPSALQNVELTNYTDIIAAAKE